VTQPYDDLIDIAVRLFWTILFSLVPAVLLGVDFGWSIGIGYFVVAAALLSVHYDAQDIRKAIQQIAKSRQS
jgi:hypothetical protein